MAVIDLSAYKDLYIQTAREQLGIIKSNFMLMRLNPQDMEAAKKAYISAHSLKGQSMVMNYMKTAETCRLLEYIFRDMTAGKLSLTPEISSQIQTVFAQIGESINTIEKTNNETDLIGVITSLQKYENTAH